MNSSLDIWFTNIFLLDKQKPNRISFSQPACCPRWVFYCVEDVDLLSLIFILFLWTFNVIHKITAKADALSSPLTEPFLLVTCVCTQVFIYSELIWIHSHTLWRTRVWFRSFTCGHPGFPPLLKRPQVFSVPMLEISYSRAASSPWSGYLPNWTL